MRCWVSVFLLCVLLVACKSNKKAGQQSVEENAPAFCKEDTSEIVRLTTEYLEHLKNKEFDLAEQMLYHIQNDTVSALTDDERKGLEQQYEMFPVFSYEITGYYIKDAHNTEVAYSIEFFKKQEDDERPNTLNFRLNPQKIDDVWYLSVLNR